jgi:hypothetical protein
VNFYFREFHQFYFFKKVTKFIKYYNNNIPELFRIKNPKYMSFINLWRGAALHEVHTMANLNKGLVT